jgi:putative two-component system response regulator
MTVASHENHVRSEKRLNIIVIDDSKSMLAAMWKALSPIEGVEIVMELDPVKAVELCRSREFDLILVDHMMPGLTGIDVIRMLRRIEIYKHVPMVMVTAQAERSIRLEAIEAGATEFLNKPFDDLELRARVSNLLKLRGYQLELADRAGNLQSLVDQATARLAAREEEIIWRLARAIEFRDGATGGHVSRVARISHILAEEVGLSPESGRLVYLASPLHDIGKIGISDAILSKPGRLTAEEMSEMRRHVDFGKRILEEGSSDLIKVAEVIAYCHHEKWDGTGYPRGISGLEIPLEARVVAIADVLDALCSERPYKSAMSPQAALDHIVGESGRHFDPACVEALVRTWPKILGVLIEMHSADLPGIEVPAARA